MHCIFPLVAYFSLLGSVSLHPFSKCLAYSVEAQQQKGQPSFCHSSEGIQQFYSHLFFHSSVWRHSGPSLLQCV